MHQASADDRAFAEYASSEEAREMFKPIAGSVVWSAKHRAHERALERWLRRRRPRPSRVRAFVRLRRELARFASEPLLESAFHEALFPRLTYGRIAASSEA